MAEGPGIVAFSEEFSLDSVCMFELPEDLLEHIHSGEDTLLFVGDVGTPVKAVSGSKTYNVKTVDSSNTRLLLIGDKISHSTSCHYEFVLCNPEIGQLRDFLRALGPEGARLSSTIQASRAQIRKAMHFYGAYEFAGVVYMSSVELLGEVVEAICNVCMALGWVDPVTSAYYIGEEAELLKELVDCYPDHEILNAVRMLSCSDGTRTLDSIKICRTIASKILIGLEDHKCDQDEFMRIWRNECSGYLEPDSDMLSGVAINRENEWQYIGWWELSLDMDTRIRQLGGLKKSWLREDLDGFFEELYVVDIPKSSAMLSAKHLYSSKGE